MKGSTVQIEVLTQIGEDGFNEPIFETQLVDVDDVLVGSPSTDDITQALQLYGKKIDYVLGIPKGDTHDWVDAVVHIFGDKYRTVGFPMTGEQANIPLRWGKNVKVERYG